MRFFRRREEQTFNEQLLSEAGLDQPEAATAQPEPTPQPDEPRPFDPYVGTYPAQSWLGVTRRAMPRPSDYDAVVTAHAPQLAGDVVEFATLPNGDVIVDEEQGDADLSPLAEAVERELRPPYRAYGRNEGGDLWAVAARRTEVVKLSFEDGDAIELVRHAGALVLRVDGVPSSARIPELESAGAAVAPDYVVEAERLDGDFWEVRTGAL
jgi:hypothetical protein